MISDCDPQVWRQSTLFIWFVVFYLMHPITQLNTAEEGTRGGSGGLPAYAIDLSGFPEFEQMQHEFIQNPDMIVETIHQPFAQIMMSYPDVMRNILLSDPISRQVIDRDPDLASILYDPSIFSQMTEILRHTSVEFIRNLIRIAEGAGGGDGGSSDGGDGGSSGGATQTHPAVIDLSNPAVSHNVQDMNQVFASSFFFIILRFSCLLGFECLHSSLIRCLA